MCDVQYCAMCCFWCFSWMLQLTLLGIIFIQSKCPREFIRTPIPRRVVLNHRCSEWLFKVRQLLGHEVLAEVFDHVPDNNGESECQRLGTPNNGGGIINPKWRCMTAVHDDHAHDPQNLVAKLVLSIVPPVEWVIHNDWALSEI